MAKVLVTESYLNDTADAIREKNGQTTKYKVSEMAAAVRGIPVGTGDMEKSVYDTNDNGIVDNAEAVNGHTVAKDVPADAKFTDTVYDDTALSSRVTSAEGSITSLQTAVASKANQSDLTALGTRVTTAEGDIDALETRMTDAEDDLSRLPEPAASDGVFVVTQNNQNMTLTPLDEAVSDKADIDGTYPEMAVGELLSSTYLTDQAPYLLRQSGGGMAIGGREWDEIVGGTVAWNQLIGNGNMHSSATPWRLSNATLQFSEGSVKAISNSTGQFNINQTVGFKNNHIYLIVASVNSYDIGTSLAIAVSMQYTSLHTISANQKVTNDCWIRKATADLDIIIFTAESNTARSSYIELNKCMAFDLTALFGSAIADYIYSLEQANVGAGVAYFRKLFPNDYYEYNAGSLESVQTSGHKMVGFNQFDGQWEYGQLNPDNGQPAQNNSFRRTKYLQSCVSSATYYVYVEQAGIIRFFWYDADKNYIGSILPQTRVITIPSNVSYFKMHTSDSTIDSKNICINISNPTKNGTYEPYKEWTYPLDSSLTLRGIPKLDSDNNLYYDGDTYAADGTVTRKYGIVDLGTLTWATRTSVGGRTYYNAPLDLAKSVANSEMANSVISNIFELASANVAYADTTSSKSLYTIDAVHSLNCYPIASYTDAYVFKAAMSGVYLVYELATPTTETATPFTSPQIVDRYGTEEYITTGIVSVGHSTKYTLDLLAKLEALPDQTEYQALLASIAPPENGTTASKAYSAGQYFMKGAQLCKAKTAIASGATFTLNTNYETTTVAAELYAAMNS